MYTPRPTRGRSVAICAGVAIVTAGLAACSSEPSSEEGGAVEISYLVPNDPVAVETAERMIAVFNEKHAEITVVLQTQPAGTEGDNLTKTKLATGEMEDVFSYNSGSLLMALNPDDTLVDLSDEPWVASVTDDFLSTVRTEAGMYGAPTGTSFGGGVLYNREVYAELGLEIPTSWAAFIDNSRAIKEQRPDVAPVLQAFGETWTSQIFVLADFANIAQQDPEWAARYTANEVKYAEQPALAGFVHQQEVFDEGLLNENFPSLTHEQALMMLAEGEAAQYPMLTNAVNAIASNNPDQLDDVGFFALPADDPQYTAATIWQPNGLYIPKTTTGPEADAAKTFVEFLTASPEACAIGKETGVPAGPYVIDTCPLDDDVPQMVKDVQTYFDSGKTAPALEFLSPIKGPNLENIAIEVGSGIRSAQDGAATYDEDVKKQAQQLGLPGW